MAFRWRADGGPFGLLGICFSKEHWYGSHFSFVKKKPKYKIVCQNFGPGPVQVYCNELGKIMCHTRHWNGSSD